MRHFLTAATLLFAVGAGQAACIGGSDASEQSRGESARSGGDEDRPAESASGEPSLGESARNLRDVARLAETAIDEMRKRADQPVAEPVDFRKLRDLLPEQLVGLARTDMKGEKRQLMGTLGISEASATYADAKGDEAANLIVEIQDLGGLSSFSALGVTWLLTSIDSETASGFKRTREINGHRAYEEFDSGNGHGRGRIEVFVADRFLVKVQGQQVEMDVIQRAIQGIDLGALARMQDEGRSSPANDQRR
jgi:hypothetical protein